MLKRVAIVMCAVAMSASAYAQQQPKPAAPAKEPAATVQPKPSEHRSEAAPKAAPEPPPQPVNIKIEVSITDQTAEGTPAKKVVTMMVGDRQRNSIRSSASVPVRVQPNPGAPAQYNYRNVTINVDARPAVLLKEPSKVQIMLGLEYFPKSGGGREDMEPGMASLNEQLSLILESGKPTIVSQAADPTSDRKITVEVTATILK